MLLDIDSRQLGNEASDGDKNGESVAKQIARSILKSQGYLN
jgi:hypothetical protein